MDGQRYFTVTTSDAGFADKVEYQLHILYRLGEACGFHYIHTPLTFPRSWHSPTHSLTNAKNAIERKLFLDLEMRIPGYRLIHGALSKVIGLLDNAIGDSGDKLNRFLGLDKITPRITDACFSNFQITDIPVEDILMDGDVKILNDLRAAIDRWCPLTHSKIYRFTMEQISYPSIAKIKNSLMRARVDMDSGNFLRIRNNYWSAREHCPVELPFDPMKIKVVIHCRLGDWTVIPIGDRSLYVHGSLVSREQFEKIDPMAQNTPIGAYEHVMCRMFTEFGPELFSCIFISDGYARTLESIVVALRRKELALTRSEFKLLQNLAKTGDQSLRDAALKLNAYAVIGESNETLCKAIHAIANADVLVYGNNKGFSYGVHKLFHKGGSSVKISVEDDLDAACRAVDEMMKLLKQPPPKHPRRE
jgi:hypothetical protein